MSEPVILRRDGAIATVTLNKPERMNALDRAMWTRLGVVARELDADESLRCVVLRGAGDRAFAAGADIAELEQRDSQAALRAINSAIFKRIEDFPVPSLAAIRGFALGGGCELALACDLRIAADSARFVVGFAGIGLAPDSGVSLLLPALIGLARATEFTFSNAPITADQALAWGLINRVVPTAELPTIASNLAAGLAHGPIGALALAKRAFNQALLGNLESVLDYEAHLQEIASASPEHAEGVQAFLEKRPPRFV